MSEINYNINLDYDPENEELAVILNNADNFCNALELADIYFDSIKICIDSPKHYRICKREAPLKITVPIQEDDWDEDDEEEFFDADKQFYYAADFILKAKPKYFVFENVPGFVDARPKIAHDILKNKDGNSCNFISISENKYNLDIYALLGILNSNLLNWYFKLISSNNHINNYELDELPIPLFSSKLQEISNNVQEYLLCRDSELLLNIDSLVNEAYGITNKDTKNTKIINKLDNDLSYIIPSIQNNTNIRNIDDLKNYLVHNNIQLNDDDLNMAENLVEKYYKLNHNNILNHTTFKLSDLDMEMIVNIPQGGNWQNIPDNIIKKSERLKKIKQTGGRTTLYGLLNNHQKTSCA